MPRAEPIFIDDEYGSITRSEFRRLKKAEKKDVMEAWFRERYEDPANETPRLDGEYHFICGGPYDPSDELGDRFGDLAPDDLIQSLATELGQEGGWDWAPRAKYQNHDDSDFPEEGESAFLELGSEAELKFRRDVLDRLHAVEEALANRPKPPPLLGHNRPPESIYEIGEGDLQELATAVAEIKAQLS